MLLHSDSSTALLQSFQPPDRLSFLAEWEELPWREPPDHVAAMADGHILVLAGRQVYARPLGDDEWQAPDWDLVLLGFAASSGLSLKEIEEFHENAASRTPPTATRRVWRNLSAGYRALKRWVKRATSRVGRGNGAAR